MRLIIEILQTVIKIERRIKPANNILQAERRNRQQREPDD